jgi:hypothetical protein
MQSVQLNGYTIPAPVFAVLVDHSKSTLFDMACLTTQGEIPAHSVCGKAVQQVLSRSEALFDVCDFKPELALVVMKQINVLIYG